MTATRASLHQSRTAATSDSLRRPQHARPATLSSLTADAADDVAVGAADAVWPAAVERSPTMRCAARRLGEPRTTPGRRASSSKGAGCSGGCTGTPRWSRDQRRELSRGPPVRFVSRPSRRPAPDLIRRRRHGRLNTRLTACCGRRRGECGRLRAADRDHDQPAIGAGAAVTCRDRQHRHRRATHGRLCAGGGVSSDPTASTSTTLAGLRERRRGGAVGEPDRYGDLARDARARRAATARADARRSAAHPGVPARRAAGRRRCCRLAAPRRDEASGQARQHDVACAQR